MNFSLIHSEVKRGEFRLKNESRVAWPKNVFGAKFPTMWLFLKLTGDISFQLDTDGDNFIELRVEGRAYLIFLSERSDV